MKRVLCRKGIDDSLKVCLHRWSLIVVVVLSTVFFGDLRF
jgi:hypothetical protein